VTEYISQVRVGDWVIALAPLWDMDPNGAPVLVALPGQLGHVIEQETEESLPNIYWETTKRVFGGVLGVDFAIACDAEFASDEENTPESPRLDVVKRGLQ
jgi:hypothetical protein